MPALNNKSRVSLIVVGVCAALLALGALIQVRLLRGELTRGLADQQSADLDRVAAQIDDALRDGLAMLSEASRQLPGARLGEPDAIRRFLAEFPAHQLVDELVVLDARGRVVADMPPLPGRPGMALSTAQGWQALLNPRRPQISPPFSGRMRKEPLVTLTAPVLDGDGELVAVTMGVLRLYEDNVLGRVATQRVGGDGYYSILTRDAVPVYVMHPDRSRILKPRTLNGEQAVMRALHNVNWLLVSTLPTGNALAPVQRAERRLILGSLLLALPAAPFAWLLARRWPAPRDVAAERALRDSEAHLRAITDSMPAMVSYLDTDQRFRYANRTYQDWLGVDPESLIGKSLRELYGDAVYERIAPYIRRALAGENVEYERELQTITHVRQVHVTQIPHRDERGTVLGVHVLMSDITARSNEERRLRQLSLIDALTGLLNRTGFDLRLDEAIVHARQTGTLMALMYLDIDHFKSINDSHGHPVGDALLRELALRLRSVLRSRDAICRVGGDEFTLVLEELDETAHAALIADKIIEVMRAPFQLDGHVLTITASLGVAFHDGGPQSRQMLERRADEALYGAKRAGRDRYRVAPTLAA